MLNYEEGGERSILHGDKTSEVFLTEVPGGTPREKMRDEQVESVYDYGSRAGLWRILRLFRERKPGDAVPIVFERRGARVSSTLTLVEDPSRELVTAEDAGQPLSDLQRRFRDAWLGSAARNVKN